MKHKNVTFKALIALSFALTASCNDSNKSAQLESPFLSPIKNKVQINSDGEKTVTFNPLNTEEWTNPDLQNLALQIQESRRKRVTEKLKALDDEAITFTPPVLTLQKDGLKRIDINLKFQDKDYKIAFLSPRDHGQDFYFDQISGFDQRKVKLQGMCLDDEKSCSQIAIKVSYVGKRTLVTEDFIINSTAPIKNDEPATEGVTPEEEPEVSLLPEDKTPAPDATDPVDPVVSTDEDDKDLAPPEIILIDENEKKEVSEKKDEDEDNAVKIDLSKVNEDNSTTGESGADVTPTEEPTKKIEEDIANNDDSSVDTTPAPKEDPPVDDETPADNKGETTADHGEDDGENSPDMVLGAGQIIFPDLPNDDADDEADKGVTEEFNVNSAEVTPVVEEELDPIIEIDDTVTEPKPEEPKPEEPKLVVVTSPLPKPRPKNLVVNHSHAVLLANIQNTVFKQSRGFYSAHAIRGRIKKASQLERKMDGAVVNPARRSEQYGSGMLKSVLEYVAKKLEEKHSNSPICINDLSAKNGGKLSGHGSHRNGLDADISLPSSSNKCSGSTFFQSWSKSKERDADFMKRNWFLLNTLIETDRVHVIFTSSSFVKSMCSYAKKNSDLSRSERNKIFKKLHHVKGHHKHFHVRLKCNKQNPGCVTQGILAGSKCN